MLKLGTTNINLPFAKAFLGSNLVYQKSSGIEFTACPFPTSWAVVTQYNEYTATNDYGTWRIWAERSDATYNIAGAFNGDTANNGGLYYAPALSSDTATSYAGIDLPSGVLIKPTQVLISSLRVGNATTPSTIEGLNENGEWETLVQITRHSVKKTETLDITTNNYYSKFRLKLSRYSSSYTQPAIYEFQITSGTIRKEA